MTPSLLLRLGLSLLVPLCGATAAGSAGSAALWKSLLSDGLYPIPAVEPSTQPLVPSLLQSQPLLRGHPFRGSQKQVLAGSGNTMYHQEKNAGSINNQGSEITFEPTQTPLLRGHPFRGSQKQVLPGSGNTMYQQEKNAGSINNQGSVNNQRSKVYRDGPGLGSASTVQSNSQTQSADTNPVTTTVSVDSPSTTNDYTGSSNGLYGLAGSGLGVPGGMRGLPVAVAETVLPFANGVLRHDSSPVCESQQSGGCTGGGLIPLSRASGHPALTISSIPSGLP